MRLIGRRSAPQGRVDQLELADTPPTRADRRHMPFTVSTLGTARSRVVGEVVERMFTEGTLSPRLDETSIERWESLVAEFGATTSTNTSEEDTS